MDRLRITRNKCWDYVVDGKPLLVPDADIEISQNDLDSDDSGRDESGVMHRHRIREGVKTWGFSYQVLTYGEYCYLESLFRGKQEFEFVFANPDPYGTYKKCRAYRSKSSITLHNSKTGLYKNYKFNIIEC